MSSFTDPGYLPRSSPHEAINIEKENNLTVDSSGKYYPMPKSKTVKINDCEYEIKYCVSFRNNWIKILFKCFLK